MLSVSGGHHSGMALVRAIVSSYYQAACVRHTDELQAVVSRVISVCRSMTHTAIEKALYPGQAG